MSSKIRKGPALLIFLLTASAIAALGVFVDGRVIPPQPNNEELIKEAAAQSALSKRQEQTKSPAEPSDVSRQLERALEVANQNEADTSERLEKRVAKSKALIDETNQLLVEKGVPGSVQSSSDKSKQFNQQLNDLKARLTELKSSE